MHLLPYKPADDVAITSWLKSEYLMRQWCADRYKHSVDVANDEEGMVNMSNLGRNLA